jgi:hypothetical protein
MASSNHPIGLRGLRAVISNPRTPVIAAPMKYENCAVIGESIAFQSRTSRTRLAAIRPSEPSATVQASRTAQRSPRVVTQDTILIAARTVDGAVVPLGWC